MSHRHFLDIAPVSKADLRAILDEAHRRKRARLGWPKGKPDEDKPLDGHVLAMIFEKASTRTRVSFEVGMTQLGGTSIMLSADQTQLGRGETIEDTARVLSRMVDIAMLRTNAHQTVLDFAEAASIPVVNGLTDFSHPVQIIADLQTIEERMGDVRGKTIAWLGDGNNVCLSFIQAASKFGFKLKIATPTSYAPNSQEMGAARAAGADVSASNDAKTAVDGADVVVTDTWVSMGDVDKDARLAAFPPFSVDDALLARANKDALFLHCLPAHRGEEMSASVIDGPQSAVFDEAENRIHAQKAVMLWCLGKL